MDELFDTQLPGGRSPDIQLCIFPHLKEFLVIDLRESPSRVSLFHTEDVFVEDYFRIVEADFAEVLREETDFPFSHLIDLPLRLEEIMRDTAMTLILRNLGVEVTDYDQIPNVVVFVISGGALTTHSDHVLEGLRELITAHGSDTAAADWEDTISRLVADEKKVLQQENLNELSEVMRGDPPNYFTLWESRN